MTFSFAERPDLAEGLFDLLDVVFPGIRKGVEEIRRYGASWESVSTPFVHLEGGRVVSHVGLIELPLVIRGEIRRVGTVHAVASHPEHRRRGLYRGVMDELIAASEGRFETLVLTTEHPEYFEPFGFRRVQEHRFRFEPRSSGGRDRSRTLDPKTAGDLAVLHRLLEERSPVSGLLGVAPEKAIFLFNEARRSLRYDEELDAILCMEQRKNRLELFDVVAKRIPPLGEILSRLPDPIDEVVVHFAPDLLGGSPEAIPGLFDHDGPSHLLVRGPFAVEGEPFALPRSART